MKQYYKGSIGSWILKREKERQKKEKKVKGVRLIKKEGK